MKAKKKRAPQDLTLRNLRALKRRLAIVEVVVRGAHILLDGIEGKEIVRLAKRGRR